MDMLEMEEEDECVLKLPLGEAAKTFNLETAVCSHGLFMMSPNRWDPLSRSLSRPLRVSLDDDDNSDTDPSSVTVTIYHPQQDSNSLHVKVDDSSSGSVSSLLSSRQREALLGQVRRMLRLSETEERNVREFKRVVSEVAEDCEHMKEFSGRVFRSPTLFEDMVKCILLCNCNWSRTLSMARALCELQWELWHCPSRISVAEAETENFIPTTPAGKESTIKRKASEVSTKLTSRIAEMKECSEEDMDSNLDCVGNIKDNLKPNFLQNNIADDSSCLVSYLQFSEGREPSVCARIGNFPSPKELAKLDESVLAKRCNLGYRAGRILKLAQGIVEGKIQLRELEEICNKTSLTTYVKLAEELSSINGFGPFTRANVLVCMGFYHVIPTDSETIRHLKQVHGRQSHIKTVPMDVEAIYGKYAPFQFLAYWSELWHFYEERFGKLSEMPHSDYKLITACNMRIKNVHQAKKSKISGQRVAKMG